MIRYVRWVLGGRHYRQRYVHISDWPEMGDVIYERVIYKRQKIGKGK